MPGLPIAEVARRTRIPVTTLRFYEKELPGLFRPRKTAGGHRRYTEEDVARFAAVRRLTAEQGLGLSRVRRVMSSRGDAEPLRERTETLSRAVERCELALTDIAARVARIEARLEEVAPPKRRRGWFQ